MKISITSWILRSIRTLGLAAVLLAQACAPAVTPTPGMADATLAPLAAPTQTLKAVNQPQVPTVAAVATLQIPQAVPTPRGPNLEATDPTTVALASGGLQLVEFFRFT